MDKNYAIGIILIPDEPMYTKTIELSRDLKNNLNETSIPHITLVHGGIDTSKLNDLKSIIENLSADYSPFNLVSHSKYVGPMSGSFWMNIAPSEKLTELQRNLVTQTNPLIHYGVNSSMFVKPLEIGPEPQWVKDFPEKASLENYKPHITLGIGTADVDFPIPFSTSRLGVYQLGKGCSSQKELFIINLDYNKTGSTSLAR